MRRLARGPDAHIAPVQMAPTTLQVLWQGAVQAQHMAQH